MMDSKFSGPKLSYSIGVRLAGGGIGNIAYHSAKGLHSTGHLKQLLVGSFAEQELPTKLISELGLPSRLMRRLAVYDSRRWITLLHNILFDQWASMRLQKNDVFYGWNGFCLKTVERAKDLGMKIVIERASSHPLANLRLLSEEYERWGLRFRMPRLSVQRAIAELEAADKVIIPSKFVRQTFEEVAYPAERLIEIPFGVALDKFAPDTERASNMDTFRVIFVGQVGIRKGVPDLLQAWKTLNWPADTAELWLAGRVSGGLRRILPQFGELPGVQFLGHVAQVEHRFRQADVFVFPSIEEGSALVTYEAMASGLPVITTPNSGSLVRDSRDGYLVPINSPEAIANRLEQLRSNLALRVEMGQSARARVEDYSWDRYQRDLTRRIQQV